MEAHIASNDAEASHTRETLKRKYREKETETTASAFQNHAAEGRIRRSRILNHSGAGIPLRNELHGLGHRASYAAGAIWAAEVQRSIFTRAAASVYGYVTALCRKDDFTFVATVESDFSRTKPSHIQ